MDNLGYLFVAYALIFLVIFLYVFGLSRKQKQILKEIESINEVIKGHSKQEHLSSQSGLELE